jgi:hypothetical protein
MNAFLAVSQMNRQRQMLEERIHDQNLKMTLAEAEHERKIEAMNINAALAVNRLNLQAENAQTRAYYEGVRTDIARSRADDMHEKLNMLYGDNEQTDKLSAAIRQLGEGSNPGTQKYGANLNKLGLDYSGVIANNKRAESLFKDAELRHEKARSMLDRQSAALQKQIENLTKKSEVQQGHYLKYGDEYFAHSTFKGNPTRFMGFDAAGNPIMPNEKGQIVGAKTHITVPASSYETVRSLIQARDGLMGGGADTLPDHADPGTKVKMIHPDGGQVLVPQGWVDRAKDQGFTLVPNQ